jgi:hypothetical protein
MAAEEDIVSGMAAEMDAMDVEPPAFLDPSEVGEEVEDQDGDEAPPSDDDDEADTAGSAAAAHGKGEGEEEEDDDDDTMIEIEDDSVQGFFDHTDALYCVAINPEFDDIVCTGGGDDHAFLWDRTSGDCAFELKGELMRSCGSHSHAATSHSHSHSYTSRSHCRYHTHSLRNALRRPTRDAGALTMLPRCSSFPLSLTVLTLAGGHMVLSRTHSHTRSACFLFAHVNLPSLV